MPFMSYQASIDEAMRSAGRMLKEGGAEAVKLEGGAIHAELVGRLVGAGIPVMGHIGLTPQSVHQLGGFKVQGREQAARARLVDDAKVLEEAGAYAIVLEGIPLEVAADITRTVSIPTIGIGAGPHCDGQVLVIYDLLGMNDEFKPKFVKRYENLALRIRTAVDEYLQEVKSGEFPSENESFFLEPASAPQRRNASVSAIALAGGCAPSPDGEAGSSSKPADPDPTFYSTPRKKE
jgi:3-methyl-2-oxobutanoate hydroxymethyltransferase